MYCILVVNIIIAFSKDLYNVLDQIFIAFGVYLLRNFRHFQNIYSALFSTRMFIYVYIEKISFFSAHHAMCTLSD